MTMGLPLRPRGHVCAAILAAAVLVREGAVVLACTTVAVTPGASADGSVLAAHTNDGEPPTDSRLVAVPAADHEDGSMRPIFFSPESYPRYVGGARGVREYAPVGNQAAFVPIGQIPQVKHTYSYLEETSAAINEHQVAVAESTCSGVFGTSPRGQEGGKALFSIDALTQLAMERTTSARGAVRLMGDLAVKEGFYGAGSFEGTSESLLVSDPKEVWIFHILPDPTGASAIWAAQRVPDGHVAVVANAFMIRSIDPVNDTDNFMASDTAYSVARSKGWWDGEGLLDFTAVYSDGEYDHKYYSGRRVWGAYRLLAPSANFSASYEEWRKSAPYPATVKPDSGVDVGAVLRVLRDHYDGTPFDLSAGPAAGPFGDPVRYAMNSGSKIKGSWERSISLHRTSDSYVAQLRPWLPRAVAPVLWFAPGAAHATAFVPFSPLMSSVPHAYSAGNGWKFERESMVWATKAVGNLMSLRWDMASVDIAAAQREVEAAGAAAVSTLASACAGRSADAGDDREALSGCIEGVLAPHAEWAAGRWWALSDEILFKYADGFVNSGTEAPPGGYPDAWLKSVGYPDGPPPVPKGAAGAAVADAPRRAGTLVV